jgi:hypothetical protein
MTISQAMDELVEKVRELGVGDYFDGLDYDNIIELGLYYYRKHIEEHIDEIKEEMYPDEVDSESDEPVHTEAYQDIDPDSTYGAFPEDMDDDIEPDWCDFCEMSVTAERGADECPICPHCGEYLRNE